MSEVHPIVLLVAVCVVAAVVALLRHLRGPLPSEGVLSRALRATETIGRWVAILLLLGFLTTLAPPPVVAVFPWVLVALAVAVGWSARDAIADLAAWMLLASERRVRLGRHLRVAGREGRVVAWTPRALWLQVPTGQHTCIPNRILLREPIDADPSRWARIEVSLRLEAADPVAVRHALREAVLASPWVAPRPEIEIEHDPEDTRRWTVRARILEPTYRSSFAGTLHDRFRHFLARADH